MIFNKKCNILRIYGSFIVVAGTDKKQKQNSYCNKMEKNCYKIEAMSDLSKNNPCTFLENGRILVGKSIDQLMDIAAKLKNDMETDYPDVIRLQ